MQLKNVTNQLLQDFDSSSANSIKKLKLDLSDKDKLSTHTIPYDQLVDTTIPFCDNFNNTLGKISHLSHHMNFFNEVCKDISKSSKDNITNSEAKLGKQNFDIVCNYSLREKEGITHTKDLYDESQCKYLTNKTFRKSASDTFGAMLRVDWDLCSHSFSKKQNFNREDFIGKKMKLGCLGGGPGSDLTGILSYFIDMDFYYNFDCTIYDSKHLNWEKINSDNLRKSYDNNYDRLFNKNFGKGYKEKHQIESGIKVEWKFVDFDDKETVANIDGSEEIVSICWALNETCINKSFWEAVIAKLRYSLIVIIEGDIAPLLQIIEILDGIGRKYLAEIFESPRRVIVYPENEV